MTEAGFRSRTIRWVVGIASVSFVLGLVLAVFGPELLPVGTVAPSGYSRSALGHEALAETLKRLGVPVVVSRFASASKAGRDGVLLILEPRVGEADSVAGEMLRDMLRLEDADDVLLVLPKWWGDADPKHEGWVQQVNLLAEQDIQAVLDAAGIQGRVEVLPTPAHWSTSMTVDPTFPVQPVQVIVGSDLEAIVTHPAGGILLGHVPSPHGDLYVLADPDPLSNSGLHHGENAPFVLEILGRLRDRDGAVVFDETLHGLELQPSIWRELFSFPLIVPMLQLILCLALLVWAGSRRFGRPRRSPPPLEPGTAYLVRSTAELLRHGTRAPTVLPRYLEATLARVARQLNAPAELPKEELALWLDRIAAGRGAKHRVADLEEAAGAAAGRPHRILLAAQIIHQWRREILDGAKPGRTNAA